MFNLVAFILLVFPLVVIHEYGHLLVGKWLGAKPVKFAVGFGNPIFEKELGGVKYSVRPIPLGGFVEFGTTQFPGLEPDKESISSWKWIFISLAGPVANFLFAYLVIFVLLLFGSDNGLVSSLTKSYEMILSVFSAYINLFSNIFSGDFLNSVSGPVGIAKASGEALSEGIGGYIKMSVNLSFALGFMNLLPLPVLDGGRALISAYETIFRTKMNELVFKYTSILATSALLVLIIFTIFKDLKL